MHKPDVAVISPASLWWTDIPHRVLSFFFCKLCSQIFCCSDALSFFLRCDTLDFFGPLLSLLIQDTPGRSRSCHAGLRTGSDIAGVANWHLKNQHLQEILSVPKAGMPIKFKCPLRTTLQYRCI